MDFTEETATAAVVESFAATADVRTRELLQRLIPHLHDYVREVRPTIAEWERAIRFLTETGQKCDDTRQEYVLLSDVLGISMLVETINGQTEGTDTYDWTGVKDPQFEKLFPLVTQEQLDGSLDKLAAAATKS